MLRGRGLEWPTELIGQIGAGHQTIRQDRMKAGPFPLRVLGRIAMNQVVHLAGVVLEVIELIVEPLAVEAEIDRIAPVALADCPNGSPGVPAGTKNTSSKEKIVWSCTV